MEVLLLMSATAPWLSGTRGAVAAVAVSCSALMMGAYANLSIAPIAPLIRADLGISLTAIGFITSAIFLGAAVASTPSGHLTVETVYCLGNCALGPAALIDGALVGRVDKDLLDAVCAERPHERMEG